MVEELHLASGKKVSLGQVGSGAQAQMPSLCPLKSSWARQRGKELAVTHQLGKLTVVAWEFWTIAEWHCNQG